MKNMGSSYEFAILNSVFITLLIKPNDYTLYLYMYSGILKKLSGFLFLSNLYVNKYTKDVYPEKII